MSNDTPSADYLKWYRWAYEQRYGQGSWDADRDASEQAEPRAIPKGFVEYLPSVRKFWDEEKAVEMGSSSESLALWRRKLSIRRATSDALG